ncbi:MAG: AarF/ABC1/UbiB kinase family protein [SAR324 cluster bacterium]|nr:AarF/ABC1/UbiB kinase family protein [SAR324 cluster bacterium]
MNPRQDSKKKLFNIPVLRERTGKIIKEAGNITYKTFQVPQAFIPLTQLLGKEDNISQQQLSGVLDKVFAVLYAHPLTHQTRKMTSYLRQQSILPNEETTENLIRYVLNQTIARSPVPVPEAIINEFWSFFHELFSAPELRGLMELNLDIVRLVLKTYEPLLVELINLLKETRRINQAKINELITRVQVIRGDIHIIRRQIKALRYIKPFFQADPRDFHTQAQIVARMVREFGPFFIKMAQVAAANSDFLPQEIAQELLVFQEDVPPMSAREVLDAFEECYGKSPYECYFGFDTERPIKSGSIGSVYLAKKPCVVDGKEVLMPVVIKIGRHNLDREFLMGKTVIGLALLSSQFWAPHSKLAPFLEALRDQVDEFVEGFQQELNFEDEAIIQRRFAERSKQTTMWKVPQVYHATHRIMEMEYLEGAVSINRAMQTFGGKSPKFARAISERFLYTVMMHMVVYNEFHGDLHPGNIMVNEAGELYLIDWGNTVNMTGKWKPVLEYVSGALSADVDKLTDSLISLSTLPEENRIRRDEIRSTLEETLKKKNIKPLGKNFAQELLAEGIEGLHKRFQTTMQMMSNTQQLGLVIRSEYLHLSRSVSAMTGSYANLYVKQPKHLLVTDLLKAISHFPLNLMKDRFEVRRKQLREQIKQTMPFSFIFEEEVAPAPEHAQAKPPEKPWKPTSTELVVSNPS